MRKLSLNLIMLRFHVNPGTCEDWRVIASGQLILLKTREILSCHNNHLLIRFVL